MHKICFTLNGVNFVFVKLAPQAVLLWVSVAPDCVHTWQIFQICVLTVLQE